MVHPASRNSDHKAANQGLFVGLHTHFYSDTIHYSLRSFCAAQLPTCRSSRLLSVLRRQLAPSTLLHIKPLSRPKSNKLTFLALFRATIGPPQQDNLTAAEMTGKGKKCQVHPRTGHDGPKGE
jgi:hypothetical protein